jgi:predicted peroxiredoxin
MPEQLQKLVYIFTAAGDRAEDAVTGFTLANVALSMDNEVTIVLLGYGTLLAKQGYAETVHAPERLPLKELMDSILSNGGKILCCGPCLKGRTMSKDDLVEGVIESSAVGVNEAIVEADKVISF